MADFLKPNNKWNYFRSIKIYPNGETEESEHFISVFLHIENFDELDCEPEEEVAFRFKLSKQGRAFSTATLKEFKDGYGYRLFMKRVDLFNPINNHILNETLIITCEVNFTEYL